ncbi:MAG: hypothetical protein QXT73_08270 [Candidatus Methanomethylicaceae archaeon]
MKFLDISLRPLVAGLVVVLVASLACPLVAAEPRGSFQSATQPAIVKTFKKIPDHDLQNLYGRYDNFYFGMDIIVNLTTQLPQVEIRYHNDMPPGVILTPTGMSYYGEGVAYQAGITQGSVFQTVQVTGDNKIIYGIVNLDVTIPQALMVTPLHMNIPKGTLEGLQSLR